MVIEDDSSPNNNVDKQTANEVAEDYIKSDNLALSSDKPKNVFENLISKNTLLLTLLLTIVCVISVFIGFKVFWFDKNVSDTKQMLKVTDNTDQSDNSLSRPFRTVKKLATSSAEANVLVFKNNPKEPIIDLDEMHVGDNCLDIVFWNDDVVVMESGNITITNTKNKNQRVIKASEYLKDEFSCYFQHNSKLSVINNKLFIGINDAKGTEGGLFVLSNIKQATLSAIESSNRIISEIDDQLLVDCKMGKTDAGGQGFGYCILDPQTLALKPVIHSNGTRYIGRDSNKRLLFVGQTKDYTAKYIIAVPEGKWDTYEGLIAEENIPKGYSTYTNGYSSYRDAVIFQGDGILLINLESKEPTIIAYPDRYKATSSAPDIYLSGDSTFCIDYGEYVNPHQFAYDVAKKSFVEYKETCTKQRKGGIDKIIDKVPQEYSIVRLVVPKNIFEIKEIPINDPLPNGWEEVK